MSGRHLLSVPTEEVHHGGESRFGKNSTVVKITGVTYRYGCREMVNRYRM